MEIIVVGLGPGAYGMLTGEAKEHLFGGCSVFLRTAEHPVVSELEKQCLAYESFDYLYNQEERFEVIYEKIVHSLVRYGEIKGKIIYAVPGHPNVAETTVSLLLKRAQKGDITVRTVPGMSFLDAVYCSLGIDPTEGLAILDGLVLKQEELQPQKGLILCQVYNNSVASEAKLTLMEIYPDDWEIAVIRGAGIPGGEKVEYLPLYQLDRLTWLDHLVTVYLPPLPPKEISSNCNYPLDPIVEVMQKLRGEPGCPWDKAQTHGSLKRYLLEEVYEVLEAIDENNMNKICDELGDLLLQIVFHAQIAKERQEFDVIDVVHAITDKMIRRHPHVFGDSSAVSPEQVISKWEEIKREERAEEGEKNPTAILVPKELPALMKAEKLQAKASKVGFDWPDSSGVWDKLEEEVRELKEALAAEGVGSNEVQDEFGDVLFAFCNLARWLKIDPEDALKGTCQKFIRRFQYIEKEVAQEDKKMEKMSLQELDKLWNKAKLREKSFKL